MTDAEFAAFLKDISICFETGDFALWKSRVILPFSLVTKDGPVTILTEEELEENFRAYIQAGEIMGLEEVIRKPMSIEDCKDGTFIATYRTDLMGQGRHQADPYTSSALIR